MHELVLYDITNACARSCTEKFGGNCLLCLIASYAPAFALPSHAYSTCNFASPTPNFHIIRAGASYRGSRQILLRRRHAPNKWCALSNECAPDNPLLRYEYDHIMIGQLYESY